jgi:hypothetical protein
MKGLKIFKNKDITIDPTGESYISQVALERVLGLGGKAVKRRVIDRMPSIKVNEKNQLHEDSLIPAVTVFAKEANTDAIELLAKIGKAGSRAFIYDQAGMPLGTSVVMTSVPTSYADALRLYADEVENRERLQITVDEDAISTAKSDEYYPISHVRKLNHNTKFSGIKLGRESEEMGIAVKKLYSNYDNLDANTYHGSVWLEVYPKVIL